MNLSFQFTTRDFKDFKKFSFFHQNVEKKVIGLGIVYFIAEWLPTQLYGFNLNWLIGFTIFYLSFMVGFYFLLTKTTELKPMPQQYEFIDNEINIITPNGTKTHHWSMILKVESGKNAFYFYTRLGKVYILPKRAFESAAELNDFWEFVLVKIYTKENETDRERINLNLKNVLSDKKQV